MALFGRRDKPPAELVAAVGRDDRLVAWADTTDGTDGTDGTVGASTRGLWWPAEAGHELIGWHLVNKVRWDDGVLSVTAARIVDDLLLVDLPVRSLRLSVPRDLPPVVRKRVDANIARNELVRVDDGAVRFVARRVPGQDGLCWWARLEPGTPDTDQVRASVAARIATLRAQSVT